MVLKVVMVFSISYFLITEYVLYWYLKDHYKTTVGAVVGKEDFENGGFTYRYEYVVEDTKYSATSLSNDSRISPVIGSKCLVKYLPFWPWVSVPEFEHQQEPPGASGSLVPFGLPALVRVLTNQCDKMKYNGQEYS